MYIVRRSGDRLTKKPILKKRDSITSRKPILSMRNRRVDRARKARDASELSEEEIKSLKKLSEKVDDLLKLLETPKEKEEKEEKEEVEEEEVEEDLDEIPEENEEAEEDYGDYEEEEVVSYGDSKKPNKNSAKHIGALLKKTNDSKNNKSYSEIQAEAFDKYYKSANDNNN